MAMNPSRKRKRIVPVPTVRRRPKFIPIPPKVDKRNQISAALVGVEASRGITEDWRPNKVQGNEADSQGGPPGTIPALSTVTTRSQVAATKLYNRCIVIDKPASPKVKLVSLKLNDVVLVGGDGAGSEAFRGDAPHIFRLQFGNAKELRGTATLEYQWRNTDLIAQDVPSIDLCAIDASCNGGRDDSPVPSYASSRKVVTYAKRLSPIM